MGRTIINTCAVLAVLAMFAGAPAAAAPGDIFKAQAKAILDIGVDGSVEAVDLTGVPGADASRIYREQIRQWRFEPVLEDGQPIRIRATAELDVYMIEDAEGMLELSLGRPVFRSPPGVPDSVEVTSGAGRIERIEAVQRPVPRYPGVEARRGMEADVVMLVEVGPSGEVRRSGVWTAHFLNVSPRAANERIMARFVAASGKAVGNWRFNPSSLESRRLLVPFAYRVTSGDAAAWWQIVPVPSLREAWVAQIMAPDAGSAEPIANIDDETNRFVLLNPPELPWL